VGLGRGHGNEQKPEVAMPKTQWMRALYKIVKGGNERLMWSVCRLVFEAVWDGDSGSDYMLKGRER
jgi:hypothetical protein